MLVLRARWRRSVPPYMLLLPDHLLAEGLTVVIGQGVLRFLTGRLYQAISYVGVGPKVLSVDGQLMRTPATLRAVLKRGWRPRSAKVESEAMAAVKAHTNPMLDQGPPMTLWTPWMRALGLGRVERLRALECMPPRRQERGTSALTSAAALAGCACIPRMPRVTRRPPVARLETARRRSESPFWNSWNLRAAGFGAKLRLLRWATSGRGPVRCVGASATGMPLPVVVK